MPKEHFITPIVDQQLEEILGKKELPRKALFNDDMDEITLGRRLKTITAVLIMALEGKAMNPITNTLNELGGIEQTSIDTPIRQQFKQAWKTGKRASEQNLLRW